MKRRHRFRPSLIDLETRALMTGISVPAPLPRAWLDFAASGQYPDATHLDTAAAYAAEARADDPRVVFLGDSLTWFWNHLQDNQYGPSTGQSWFDADFGPLHAEAYGIVGDKTENLLYRIDHGELASQPKVVVLMIGLNDLLAGRTPARTAANISTTVQFIHAESPGSRILLLGLLPTRIDSGVTNIDQVNASISELGTLPYVSYLNPGQALAGPDGLIEPQFTTDGIHLTYTGYHILADELLGPVREAYGLTP